MRAKYDQHGVEGLGVNFMDSAEFFSMLFGSDRFEHLLGELSLAQMARSGEPLTSGKQEQLQLLREERLAANLKALLRRWVEGDQTGFRVSTFFVLRQSSIHLWVRACVTLSGFRVGILVCESGEAPLFSCVQVSNV